MTRVGAILVCSRAAEANLSMPCRRGECLEEAAVACPRLLKRQQGGRADTEGGTDYRRKTLSIEEDFVLHAWGREMWGIFHYSASPGRASIARLAGTGVMGGLMTTFVFPVQRCSVE
eukprot:4102439-Prymnesium_polylepis.2